MLITFILGAAFALRTYRLADFLGFWFDQGRDAGVIWDLLHSGRFFLIGPTTGIEGIFLGPFYYYLIAPFYAVGSGNPVWPSLWLIILNVAAIFLVYRIGRDYFNQATGILAAVFLSFSYHFALSSRWLSNPTPLPFFAVLSLFSLLKITHGQKSLWPWMILGSSLGLGLQLEAASATFFLPATLLILILFRSRIQFSLRSAAAALLPFLATLLPQLIFDFRHDHILLSGFSRFLVAEKSFQPGLVTAALDRLRYYYLIFTNKFFLSTALAKIFALLVLVSALVSRKSLPRIPVTLLLIWWLTPVFFLLFYHGNNGYVWDYYFTGVYPALILLVAAVFGMGLWHLRWGKVLVLSVGLVFCFHNLRSLGIYFSVPYPGFISLTSASKAVDWVYTDAAGQAFNVDVYVPPVIPHAYNYLFLWRGTTIWHTTPDTQLVSRLYTLREPDSEHPQFLAAWLTRQDTIGRIETTVKVDSLTIDRRIRLPND